MGALVAVFGRLEARDEAQRLITQECPELRVEGTDRPWEAVRLAVEGQAEAAVVLKGPIAEHEQRVQLISSLRRQGFAGRIVACGSFLTEKQDALEAGAHYAFDPAQQRLEAVVREAVRRPWLAADHPYLRALFLGEWVHLMPWPAPGGQPAPAVVVTAVGLHPEEEYWEGLVAYARAHPDTRVIVVEDVEEEAAATAALTTGLEPYVVLARDGLQRVLTLGREFLRDAWLRRVSSA